MLRLRQLLLIGLALFGFSVSARAALSLSADQGSLPSGTPYAVLKPSNWDHRRTVFILPPQRADAQEAEARLDFAHPLVRSLLEEGWLVATLAYRRTGVVLKDSMEDVNQLRALVADRHGAPDRVYLYGESMGGAIAVRLVENHPDDYAGGLAVGGAFDLQENSPTIGVNFAPHRPILLLPNQSEAFAPDTYAKAVSPPATRPVLWRIARDGRTNTNVAEKYAALSALVRWVEQGVPPPPNFDATIPPEPHPSEITFDAKKTEGTGKVTAIDPVRGDLTVNFQPAEFEQLGIARGSWFALVFAEANGESRTTRVLYGFNPRSSKTGDWYALPEAEGWMFLAVHRGNAGAVSGLKVGDAVTIRRIRGGK